MRILRPIVQTLVLAMLEAKFHFPSRGGVGLELIGDHEARRLDGAFQKLRQETTRSAGVSSDALAAAEVSVEIRRRLAAARPDAFLPYPVMSLNNLGIELSELGRREAALATGGPASFAPLMIGST